ncbi:hypothetical protein N866_08290 [Actinotalea ferrariae CF5-4]|uniref:Uncharacterized protein n=1 Tax=Actinotalea ferrariae CF5-4 TaxID=948458 RepID=A0A021VMN4_9CELL|nr:ABC transporter ATP-binding protein [Actinotalea ferrariae]EYR62469.1 hypothetical protein N866_08290 [Actinotalea ferrariae CF5-4]
MDELGRDGIAGRLRDWARGSLPVGAGVELLLRAFEGRFAGPSCRWVTSEPDGRTWVDVDALHAGAGVLSGGESRVLAMAAALIAETPVDVVDIVTGLDRPNLHLVLAALAHARGSHEHTDVVADPDGVARLTRPGALVRWPT